MTPAIPKPSMHELAAKLYNPSAYDKQSSLGNNFGSTIMIINGGLECGSGRENAGAASRGSYYNSLLEYFGLPKEDHLGCAHMKPFSTRSSSNYEQNFWGGNSYGTCKVVPWNT